MAVRNRVKFYAVCSVLIVFVIGACVPIWRTFYFCPLGEIWRESSLWWVVAELPDNVRDARGYQDVLEAHTTNLVTGFLLITVALLVGWSVFRTGVPPTRSQAAVDYQEGDEGAVPDGRQE
jgi:hypothetical protein